MEELREKYWSMVRRTRSTGRISPSVIAKAEEQWAKYDPDVVKEALQIHTRQYPAMKENYTLGIMRNLQRNKNAGKKKPRNQFQKFEQREVDMEELEDFLLSC